MSCFVLEVLLDAHAGKMHALLIEGGSKGQIGRGFWRADVGMMRARQRPEQRPPLEEDRHAERQIGMMRDAVERAVVEEGVALLDVVEQLR